ncbi:hypothetical protein [Kitasatospora phosalacinea]|uniref:hypothetical protein n=1 Tax=Kitasatospora phosalacinea TaxID=2065 RepID=UPI000691129F|nr:hypothetical protein [Kitasatospora phosalacinea]
MAGSQFGFQVGELQKIQRDFEQVNQRMEEMTGKIGQIKATIAKAAATDVFSGGILGVLGAGKILAEVAGDVRDINARAEALAAAKEKLTKELGEDAAKIKKMVAAYEEVERKIAEDLKRKHSEQPKPPAPKSPGTGIDGGAGGGGGGGGSHRPQPTSPGHGGGGGGGTGGGDGGTGTVVGGPGGKFDGPKLKDHSTGDWKTKITNGNSWDAWSGRRHRKNGEGLGVLARPNLDGLSAERKAMVERALERAEHKLGYSQGAVTNGYRVDCSGLVSCAWGLPGPGLNTWGLMGGNVSHHITKADLKPGDAMISGDHTILFAGWADAAHTRYIGIEDSGDAGMVSREIPYPYFHGGSAYQPYRRNGVD